MFEENLNLKEKTKKKEIFYKFEKDVINIQIQDREKVETISYIPLIKSHNIKFYFVYTFLFGSKKKKNKKSRKFARKIYKLVLLTR